MVSFMALVMALIGTSMGLALANGPGGKQDNVTFCHATNSVSNPYVVITTDPDSIVKQGHGEHNGSVFDSSMTNKSSWGDIIPSFQYAEQQTGKPDSETVGVLLTFPGKNLPAGQEILANGCNLPDVVASPSPTASISPTPEPTESPRTLPSPLPTVTPTTPAPTVEPSVTPTTPAPTPNAPDCPDLSSVGEFFNKSGGQAVLTVTVNGEVAPFSLIGTGRDTPLPGVYEVDATAFEFPGVIHLLDLNVGDAVSVNITDGITSDTDSGVVSVNCSVGLNVGLEKFVAPVVPTNPPVPPVTPTETPTAKPSPSESVTPTVPAVPRAATSTVDVLPFTGINLGVATVVALLLILLGILGMRAGRLRR